MNDNELRTFYRNLQDRPLPPGDHEYVPLYATSLIDPVEKLAKIIQWASNDSAQLFSGFRGTGKSTELMRLERVLQARGYQVVRCDMQDYLNLTTPMDITDFLLALAGAVGEALENGPLKGHTLVKEGYWTRFAAWMTRTNITIGEVGATIGGPLAGASAGSSIKAGLKEDPTFKQRLQERLAGHLGALVKDVREFVQACAAAVARAHPGQPLVMLIDSVEHIRGTYNNADQVAAALVTLFYGHGDKLRFDGVHLVYTVPPWLKIKEPGVAAGFDAAIQLPCVSVTGRQREPLVPGRTALADALSRRGPWGALVHPADGDRIIAMSGGHLRDLLRLAREVLVLQSGRASPAEPALVDAAIQGIRGQYIPFHHEDARWLARIATTHSTELPDQARLTDLARLFDSLLVMTYDDGEEWWDVHPLVRDEVLRLARPTASPGA